MLSYAIKRIGLALLIIFVVMLAMYAMVFLVPGDPASLALGPRATPELARAAMDAVAQWKYSPTLLNGAPVEIQTVIDVNFTLLP